MKDRIFQVVISMLGIMTTALVGLNLFIVNSMDTKIFTHLTNHDLHTSIGQLVTQAEYSMHVTENKVAFDNLSGFIKTNTELLNQIKVKIDNITYKKSKQS